MREIILDTETTGLDPASGHRIIEIGCVETISKVRSGRHLQLYINPERDVPEEARRIHGLDNKFLADKPVFAAVVAEFLDFIADAPLVIHNAGFDMKFLNHELARLGFPPLAPERAIDTVALARKRFPGAPASLDALCKRFDIDASARNFHGALLDSMLLADVYLELCGGRQASILFGAEAEATESGSGEIITTQQTIPQRHFPVPAVELVVHGDYIATLKNALWKKYDTTESDA